MKNMTHLVTLSITNMFVEKPLALHRSFKMYVFMVSKIFKLFKLMSFFLHSISLNAVIVTKSFITPPPFLGGLSALFHHVFFHLPINCDQVHCVSSMNSQ